MVQNIAKKNSITAILFTHSEYFSIDFSISIKEVLNMQQVFQSFSIVKEIKKNLIKKKKMFYGCIFMIMNIIVRFNKYMKQLLQIFYNIIPLILFLT